MIIVGLGNPGRKFAKTRHNVGYMVIDKLKALNSKFKTIKPQTFMNRSGEAVKHLKASDIVVAHDDVDLPLGSVRVRRGGSSGGHNGVQSVIDAIGSDFVRVRVGVNRPPQGVETEAYVLQEFTPDEIPIVRSVIAKTADFILNQAAKYDILDQTITIS